MEGERYGALCSIEALDKRGAVLRSVRRFEEDEVSLLGGYWAMLNTSWNDEHFSWAEAHTAIAHFDCDAALEYKEEIICVFMLMPSVRTYGFGNHDFIPVESRNRFRLPGF